MSQLLLFFLLLKILKSQRLLKKSQPSPFFPQLQCSLLSQSYDVLKTNEPAASTVSFMDLIHQLMFMGAKPRCTMC
jgi:hypothetical protein